jgi:hypothetical protein
VERDYVYFFGDKHKQTQRTVDTAYTEERRRTKRRPISGAVLLGIPDRGIICGDMVDIGTGGLSVIVATQLECGQGCRVCFSVRLGTQKIAIDCLGIVVNSVCVTKGFRLGMRFIITDVREQKVIERFLADGQHSSFVDSKTHDHSNPTDPPVRLDPPSVVSFPAEMYPKTIRISDLGKR